MGIPVDFLFLSIDEASSTGGTTAPVSAYTAAPNTASIEDFGLGIKLSGGATRPHVEFDISSQSYTDLWVRFCINSENPLSGDNPIFSLKGDQGNVMMRVSTINTDGDLMLEYNNGAGFTQVGSDITDKPLDSAGGSYLWDIHYILHDTTGEVTLYIDGASKASTTGIDTKTTTDTTIDTLRMDFDASSAGVDAWFSGIVVDSADTRTLRLDRKTPTANGGETDFVGTEADIDEVMHSNVSTANYIYSETAGDIETVVYPAISSLVTGYDVEGVAIYAHCRALTDPALFLQSIGRVSSVNYDGDNSIQISAGGWTDYLWEFDVDPSTSSEWANQAAVEAMEFGWESSAT